MRVILPFLAIPLQQVNKGLERRTPFGGFRTQFRIQKFRLKTGIKTSHVITAP